MVTQTREAILVHCGKCEHEWALGFAPIALDTFAKLGKGKCPLCGGRRVLMGPLPKATPAGNAMAWLDSGDTGISSRTIWSVMMNRKPVGRWWDADVPHDPGDFGRCYRLLKVMPEWRTRLHEVALKYSDWGPLVQAWDELTALYEEELPNGTAPKLYKRIQELRSRRKEIA